MNYPRVGALLCDHEYIRTLINEGGIFHTADGKDYTIPEDWIDEELTEKVTATYETLAAQDGTYLNRVIAVRNPNLEKQEASVDDDADRMRYILVTVVPDVPFAYELNLPIVQTMGVMSLFTWEFSRAATMASQYLAKVLFAEKPLPPILNNARVEWITLYVGEKEYRGGTNISSNYLEANEESLQFDIHLCRAREMTENDLIGRLVEVYDADVSAAGE